MSKWYRRTAHVLFEGLHARKKVYIDMYTDDWAFYFGKLHLKYHVPKSTITRVLHWYIENMNRKYTPQAYDAKTFCKKFDRIVAAIQRDRRRKNRGQVVDDIMCRSYRNKKGERVEINKYGTKTIYHKDGSQTSIL